MKNWLPWVLSLLLILLLFPKVMDAVASGILGIFAFIFLFLIVILLLAVYLLPTIIAKWNKDCQNIAAIFIINFVFGWTLLGWVTAMIMALWKPSRPYEVNLYHHNNTAPEGKNVR
jgi:hypothetical protein